MKQNLSSIDSLSNIGPQIKRLRLERHLTQKQLAELAQVSFSFVNQVEKGKISVRLDSLSKLFHVFGYQLTPIKVKIE